MVSSCKKEGVEEKGKNMGNIEFIGKTHNEGLQYLYNNLNDREIKDRTKRISEIKEFLKSIPSYKDYHLS